MNNQQQIENNNDLIQNEEHIDCPDVQHQELDQDIQMNQLNQINNNNNNNNELETNPIIDQQQLQQNNNNSNNNNNINNEHIILNTKHPLYKNKSSMIQQRNKINQLNYIRLDGYPLFEPDIKNTNEITLIISTTSPRKYIDNAPLLYKQLQQIFEDKNKWKFIKSYSTRKGLLYIILKGDINYITNIIQDKYYFKEFSNSRITLYSSQSFNCSLIIRNIPIKISNWDLKIYLNNLIIDYNINILGFKRYKKFEDGKIKILPIIQVFLGDIKSYSKLLNYSTIKILDVDCQIEKYQPKPKSNNNNKNDDNINIINSNNIEINQKPPKSLLICNKCWRPGHHSKVCKQKQSTCRYCKQNNHLTYQCNKKHLQHLHQCILCNGNHKSSHPLLCSEILRIKQGLPRNNNNNHEEHHEDEEKEEILEENTITINKKKLNNNKLKY